jgi:SET domain-containing protein
MALPRVFVLTSVRCMPPRPFRLGRSRTGLGLFAVKPIRKRTRLAEYKGPRLTVKEAEKAENRGNRYLFEVNSRWTIDGTARSNIARYFNHSCNPNSDVSIRGGRVFVYTLRAIKPGEELTYNYGSDYLNNVIGKSNCKCSRCRRRRAKRAREVRAAKKRKTARAKRTRARKR